MDRPTFSPFWHRVRTLKPRLRPHVQITRQHYRGKRWHVVHDPASNQFYRLSPVAYDLVCSLDGERDVEECWKTSLSKFGDAAPTQNEVIELLGQLYNSNLLAIDATPETEQLLGRGRERTKKRIAQQAIGVMYFRLRLFNPDRMLTWLEPLFRPVLNRWGFLAWCVFVTFAFVKNILPNTSQLVAGFDKYVVAATRNPANVGWMLVVFIVLKVFHELGHGLITKRFGGQVPEFGCMLLVLIPSPFVDASACWAFPNKWQRVAVGAGGMLFELTLASIASFIWLSAAEGSLTQQLAYHAMLTASVATVVFNANPLMKFDGYYMLADFLEAPNLMQRSAQMLMYLCQRLIYGVKRGARPPSTQRGEQALLVTYGLLSMAYRVFLFFSITLFILGQLFAIGLVLAVWTASVWFILPVAKFIHWHATSPLLTDRRPRAWATSLVLFAGLVFLVGAVPIPDWRHAKGVLESVERSDVFFKTEGFVLRALVRPGQVVHKGDELVVLESPDLDRSMRMAASEMADARAVLGQAQAKDDAGAAAVASKQIQLLERTWNELEERRRNLVLKAPQDGVVVGSDPALLVGAWVKRGEPLCEILDDRHLRIAAALPQGEGAWFNEFTPDRYTIRFRTASRIPEVFTAVNPRSPAAGQFELPHPALSFKGAGDVEPDPRDQQGRFARHPQFIVYADPVCPGDQPVGKPGERVYLVFTLPSRPLLQQVLDRVQKVIQGRVNL